MSIMSPSRLKTIEQQLEEESLQNEKSTGFKRTRKTATCPQCGVSRPVFLDVIEQAEGGFVNYSPPRVVEWASCPFCVRISPGVHHYVHQEGGKILR